MPDFCLERAFATPLTASDERELSRRLDASARAYPVRWHKCLVDRPRARILCHLEAESPPAAHAAARYLGVRRDGAWLSAVPWAPASANQHAIAASGEPHGRTTSDTHGEGTGAGAVPLVDVMAEWLLGEPTDALRFAHAQNVCDWCLDALRVQPESIASSADGRRVVTFFCAPDAEAVRRAYRYATVPVTRVTTLSRLAR